jgi:hypothetical protein
MIWRYQLFIAGNFNQWHGHSIFAAGCHHDAILSLLNKIGAGSA